MAEPHAGRQRVDPLDLVPLPLLQVINHLDDPVILVISDSFVTVARYLVVELGYRCWDGMRVEVASRRVVLEPDNVAILKELDGCLRVVDGLVPARQNDPLIVVVLVMVAGDLLLARTGRISLYMRVQQASTIANVFQRHSRPVSDFCIFSSDYGRNSVYGTAYREDYLQSRCQQGLLGKVSSFVHLRGQYD